MQVTGLKHFFSVSFFGALLSIVSAPTIASVYDISAINEWDADGSTYPANLVRIPVCVHQKSSAEQKDGGVVHEPNPDIGTLIRRVRRKLSQHWEQDTSIRFVGWEWCNDLTSAEKDERIVLYIHPDSPNNSYLGKEALHKNKPSTDSDKGTTRFKPWGNDAKCISYDAGDARNEYSFNCVEQYGLHEFGHVLGLAHEWTHPDTSSNCRDSLSSKTSKSEPKLKSADVLNTYIPGQSKPFVPNSNFDKNSLMTYTHNGSSACADVTGVRFGSKTPNSNDRKTVETVYPAPVNGMYDVGVLAPNAGCGAHEHITIFTDDEDSSNSNESSGWMGLSNSGRNTQLEFCRVDGSQFGRLTNLSGSDTYAVLKLGSDCPPGSFLVRRTQDNESDKNSNFYAGNIWPNSQASAETKLRFCFFRTNNQQGAKVESMPDLGFNYGVFAKSSFSRAAATGKIYSDDENGGADNKLTFDSTTLLAETGSSSPSQTIEDEITSIVGGKSNTTYRIAQANTNTSPVAQTTGPYTIDEGSAIVFDGSASFDMESEKVELVYTWDIDGDGNPEFSRTASAIFGPVVYADDYIGNAIFTVSDGMFTTTKYETVHVRNVIPALSNLKDVTIFEGDTFIQTVSFVDPGNDLWTAYAQYAPTTSTVNPTINNKAFTLSHQYDVAGAYAVQVAVVDDEGGVGDGVINVTVLNRTPVIEKASLSATAVLEGDTISISGAFNDSFVESHTVTMSWGNGDITTLDHGINDPLNKDRRTFYGTYQYPDNLPTGDYVATLTVTDDDGAVATKAFTIKVTNVAPTLVSVAHTTNQTGEWRLAKLAVEFTDPGVADSHTLMVNWGDGTGDKSIAVATGSAQPVIISHRYIDNNPGNAAYTATVSVADDDGGESSVMTESIKITNVRPTVRFDTSDIRAKEGDVVTFTGFVNEPGLLDSPTATIDFGDGKSKSLTLIPRSNNPRIYDFSVAHRYGDNGPARRNEYTVTVTATDKDGGVGTQQNLARVDNVNPVVESFLILDDYGSVIGDDVTTALVGAVTQLEATFTDVGFLDTHSATVNWNGSVVPATVTAGSATSYVTSSHTYAVAGTYAVLLTVTDDDGGSHSKSVPLTVSDVSEALNKTVDDTIEPLAGEVADDQTATDLDNAITSIEGNSTGSESQTESPELLSMSLDAESTTRSSDSEDTKLAANGALTQLEKGNVVAASSQLVKSVVSLVSAQERDASLNLSGVIRLQVVAIRELYEEALSNGGRQSKRAESLVNQAEAMLRSGDFVSAATLFKQALSLVSSK